MQPRATIVSIILLSIISCIVLIDRITGGSLISDKAFQNDVLPFTSWSKSSKSSSTFDAKKSSGTLGIPGRYVVVLKDDASLDSVESHMKWISTKYDALMLNMLELKDEKQSFYNNKDMELVTFKIGKVFNGYSGFFFGELLEELHKNPDVKLVEKEKVFHISDVDVEHHAPWGLARVSHRKLETSNDYLYDSEGGSGVNVYVVDTGIKVDHDEFEGRAVWGKAVAAPFFKVDGNGHGTHCAGIVGSKTYGIAKKANLIAVGVMNMLGAGSTSDILKGLEFVIQDHQENVKKANGLFKGSVVNLSLGGGASEAFDIAVNALVNAGIHVAVAAGNDNLDACDYSPARASGPITVGATNAIDARASFSNFGSCVDIFAPGEDIVSTYIWSPTTSMSGTSMASPHVAGLLAYFLSLQPSADSEYFTSAVDPLNVKKNLIKFATKNVLSGLDKQSPNALIFNGAGSSLEALWK